mgnify:CR=1 FL=1
MYNEINEFLYPFFQIGFLLCVAFLVIWNRILILRVVKLRREKKISLGIKQLQENPWDKIEEKYEVDSIHEGIVKNLVLKKLLE